MSFASIRFDNIANSCGSCPAQIIIFKIDSVREHEILKQNHSVLKLKTTLADSDVLNVRAIFTTLIFAFDESDDEELEESLSEDWDESASV